MLGGWTSVSVKLGDIWPHGWVFSAGESQPCAGCSQTEASKGAAGVLLILNSLSSIHVACKPPASQLSRLPC